MTRIRDFRVRFGILPTAHFNAITDVAGVRVGHTTLIEGDAIRTGVTAILPHSDNLFVHKVQAAVHTINGFGKATGFEQVRELGTLETPILLTNTLNVGRVADGLVQYMLRDNPALRSVNAVVGECNDSFLNDIQGRVVTADHVFAAIETAQDGAVQEGCVGAGTGTSCYQFKGGIGTASRRIRETYTVGALVQTNFGARPDLMIGGVPVGHHLLDDALPETPAGSVMVVVATDAPLTARQLGRLARRATFGLARTGTICDSGSGDFVIAFSTAYGQTPSPMLERGGEADIINDLLRAVVESVEESVYNALVAAETMRGYQGQTLYALPHDRLRQLLMRYGRVDDKTSD